MRPSGLFTRPHRSSFLLKRASPQHPPLTGKGPVRIQGLQEGKNISWYPINEPILWQGNENEAMESHAPPQTLSPPWKVILLSDGSVTRHLKLMTGFNVKVDCLEMEILDPSSELPSGADKIPGPRLRRQVFLRAPSNGQLREDSDILVYAASWWNAEEAGTWLAQQEQPIWISLLYVFFWKGGMPLTVIYEVFSPKLERYLGKMQQS